MLSPAQKARVDELHLRKLDLSDAVLVIDVNGYIGESTKREIAYAEAIGKPVYYGSQWQDLVEFIDGGREALKEQDD